MNTKVCGLTDKANIKALVKLPIQFMGFIFYEASKRCVREGVLDVDFMKSLPSSIQKVGVFVNAPFVRMLSIVIKYNLQAVQLHGEESPELCEKMRMQGIQVIKVFSLGKDQFDFEDLKPYIPFCDYFLFDTKGEYRGGNGKTFDWTLLEQYPYNTPYFLSGGLDLDNIPAIFELKKRPFAIDVNSRFELSPGIKDVKKLDKITNLLILL